MQKKLIATLAFGLVAVSGNARAQDCGALAPITVVSTDVTVNTTWNGVIILQQPIFVKSGATLTIDPGTIIRGQPRTGPVMPGIIAGSPGALIVTQNGTIDADGLGDTIIMTTAAVDNNNDGNPDDVSPADGFKDAWTPGDDFLDDDCEQHPLSPLAANGTQNVALWGGLILLGEAPTNLNDCQLLGVGKKAIEGLTIPGFPVADATYGGNLPHDSSGTLRYVSVRHAGDEIGEGNELNGITLGAVGDGTVFEYAEVYANFDDGIEWFGGTVNGRYLHVAFVGDDTFDLDQGYTGLNQFLFGLMPYFDQNGPPANTPFGSLSGDKAGEWDGDDFNEPPPNNCWNEVGPPSTAEIYNMTVIGSTPDGANPSVDPAAANTGVQMRNGYAGQMWNSIVVNTGTGRAFDIPNPPADGGGVKLPNPPGPDFRTCMNMTAPDAQDLAVLSSTFQNTAALSDPVPPVVVPPYPASCEGLALSNGNADAVALGAPAPLSDNCYAAGSPPFLGLVNENDAFLPTGVAGKLDASLLLAAINPRPVNNPDPTCRAGGPMPDTGTPIATLPVLLPPPFGFIQPAATYRGAFDSTMPAVPGIWTTGWTTLSMAGLLAN